MTYIIHCNMLRCTVAWMYFGSGIPCLPLNCESKCCLACGQPQLAVAKVGMDNREAALALSLESRGF